MERGNTKVREKLQTFVSARNCWSVNKIPSWIEDKIVANENACPRLYDIVNAQIFYQLVRRTMLDWRTICIIIREINIFTILPLILMDNYWNIIWCNFGNIDGKKKFLNLIRGIFFSVWLYLVLIELRIILHINFCKNI